MIRQIEPRGTPTKSELMNRRPKPKENCRKRRSRFVRMEPLEPRVVLDGTASLGVIVPTDNASVDIDGNYFYADNTIRFNGLDAAQFRLSVTESFSHQDLFQGSASDQYQQVIADRGFEDLSAPDSVVGRTALQLGRVCRCHHHVQSSEHVAQQRERCLRYCAP